MKRHDIVLYLENLLNLAYVKDYCPNGLQVEGRDEIQRVVCGVTASQALIDMAVEEKVDAILVHHGYFWRGEDSRIVGIRKKRIATLLGHDINLLAYHLPLDLHPELGNNAQLARVLGWKVTGQCGDMGLVFLGEPEQPVPAGEICQMMATRLAREPLLVGDEHRQVNRVAWCTGGAQGSFEQAIAAGADLYVSGEISEQTVHLARETGIPYIAAGHHATERYGIQALGAHLAEQFGLDVHFIDIDNPV